MVQPHSVPLLSAGATNEKLLRVGEDKLRPYKTHCFHLQQFRLKLRACRVMACHDRNAKLRVMGGSGHGRP